MVSIIDKIRCTSGSNGRSGLATRAVIRASLPLNKRFDHGVTAAAVFVFPIVNFKLLFEVARLAVTPVKVSQRRAAGLDRAAQDIPDCLRKRIVSMAGNSSGCTLGIDAGQEQRFARVDIADTDDDLGIHDELLDADLAPSRHSPKVFAIELITQWLGPQAGEQRVRQRFVAPVK